jgi:hypothetical protein
MAYFPDLTPYAYGHGDHPNVVHVGWLDGVHDYPKGSVAPHLVAKLKKLATHPVELYRGKHICELCPDTITSVPVGKDDPRYDSARRHLRGPDEIRFFCPAECMSNGEIRLTVRAFADDDEVEASATSLPARATESGAILYRQMTYAAPILIVHYIEAHGYLPPAEFLKALEAVPD